MPAHVEAPFQGFVTPLVRVGNRVESGDPIAMIEAMKMEAAITAPRSGTIVRVAVYGTGTVACGDLVMVLESAARVYDANADTVDRRLTWEDIIVGVLVLDTRTINK